MKRLTILGIVVCVGLLLAPAPVIGNPTGPPGGLDVTIVGPDPLPVEVQGDANVTGNVNVTNTDPIPVTGEVNANVTGAMSVVNEPTVHVGNTANVNVVNTPLPVMDINANTRIVNVVNEPVVKAQQEGEWNLNIQPVTIVAVQRATSLNEGEGMKEIYEVPDGYKLAIEYIGFFVSGANTLIVESIYMMTEVDAYPIFHNINIPAVILRSEKAYYSGGQMVRLYASPGTYVKVWVGAHDADDDWDFEGVITMSGRLIPDE
jgi:hypothetical protein